MSDREAFEKWAEDKSFILCVSSGDGYINVKEMAREAWQAAQAQTSDAVAVADKGVLNWLDGKKFDHEADLYTHLRCDCRDGLRDSTACADNNKVGGGE